MHLHGGYRETDIDEKRDTVVAVSWSVLFWLIASDADPVGLMRQSAFLMPGA